jgi:hypothetical protein
LGGTVTEPRIYPLRISSALKVMVPAFLAFFTLVGLIIPFAEPSNGSAPPAIFFVFWFGFLAFAWYHVLSVPHTIVHHPDDRLEFRSMARKRVVPIRDLKVIEPVPNQFGFFRFRHANGKIVALIHFDGFHELLAEIKTKNPDVRLLGC